MFRRLWSRIIGEGFDKPEGVHAARFEQVVEAISNMDDAIEFSVLADGEEVRVRTRNTEYILTKVGHSRAIISGNPDLVQDGTEVTLNGSVPSGSRSLKLGHIVVGLCMELTVPDLSGGDDAKSITTSTVQEIWLRGVRVAPAENEPKA